ncbi:MAG: hypothetical protein KAR35_02170 [Candidatus Heimdallarchaeota archaeon]|nr:hypothetical protein [Candidatus Heimdallarchaeota archaeon]MCK5048160.1 hypothetical protein [Candidatus Heimdallarchaeota archaeon]
MKRSMMEKPKLDAFSSLLVGILALAGLNYLTSAGSIAVLILASAYFIAVLGVVMKEKFGPILAIGIASYDMIYAVYDALVIPFIMDILILYLAFREYQRMSFPVMANKESKPTQSPVIICVDCGAKNQGVDIRKCRICGKKL